MRGEWLAEPYLIMEEQYVDESLFQKDKSLVFSWKLRHCAEVHNHAKVVCLCLFFFDIV